MSIDEHTLSDDETIMEDFTEMDEGSSVEESPPLTRRATIPAPAILPDYPLMAATPKRRGRHPKGHATAPHALDLAPTNSKIVVLEDNGARYAILSTPAGANRLPVGDPAHKLPEGARIQKMPDGRCCATQLSPQRDRPALWTATATDAIVDFTAHFHTDGSP